MEAIVFVYAKDGVIKVLNHEDALLNQSDLIGKGWEHTQTINACAYLQYLYSCEDVDLFEEIRSLSKKPSK
jgi:hypothetical protein